MLKKLASLLFIPFIAHGQHVSVFRNAENQHLSVHSTSCEAVEREALAMSEWTRSIGQNVTPVRTYMEGDMCFADVHGVVPELLRERYRTFAKENGPNCFNTSLAASGILSHLRYTDTNELEFWLTSPLCQRVEESELRPGDIISIRDDRGKHVHSFNYISPNLSFTKDGYTLTQQYDIRDPDAVRSSYHNPVFCRSECTDEFRRCTTIENFLRENPFPDEEIRQHWNGLDELECEISETAMGVNPSVNSLVVTSLAAVETLSQTNATNASLSEQQRFFWRAMQLKVSSLRFQYRLIDDRRNGH